MKNSHARYNHTLTSNSAGPDTPSAFITTQKTIKYDTLTFGFACSEFFMGHAEAFRGHSLIFSTTVAYYVTRFYAYHF